MSDLSNQGSAICDILNADGASRIFLVCDHASNFVPPKFGSLGLGNELLSEHIAWDIGIADLTRALAYRWDALAVLCGFSRLVLDPNRAEDSKSLIPRVSEHHAIPGNQSLTDEERIERIELYHRPYHKALQCTLESRFERQQSGGPPPVVICPHSFTPVYHGELRPWHLSVMWDRDPRLAKPLIAKFRDAGYVVGDNEPYSAREETGHTMRTLCDQYGIPGVMIEVRQDLIDTDAGISAWAGILGSAVESALGDFDANS